MTDQLDWIQPREQAPRKVLSEGFPDQMVLLDLETTGGKVTFHRIIEVGLLIVEHGKIVERWNTLVDPEIQIPPFIQSLTGISPGSLNNAPLFASIAEELHEKLQGRVLVAHNARFDYGFLKNEFNVNYIKKININNNNDTFIMKSGTTTNIINGSNGTDLINYSNYNGSGININLSLTTAQVIATGDIDTVLNIEDIIGSQLDDTITGSSSDNSINGHEGSDSIISSAGSDTINGGIDASSDDTDIIDYSNQTSKIELTTASGTSNYTITKTSTNTNDSVSNIEEVIATDYNDTLTGADQKDVFKAGSGDDTLKGNAGEDSLSSSSIC